MHLRRPVTAHLHGPDPAWPSRIGLPNETRVWETAGSQPRVRNDDVATTDKDRSQLSKERTSQLLSSVPPARTIAFRDEVDHGETGFAAVAKSLFGVGGVIRRMTTFGLMAAIVPLPPSGGTDVVIGGSTLPKAAVRFRRSQ